MKQKQYLPQKVKRFIVMSLAKFNRLTEVQKQVQTEFGLTVGFSSIQRFDPTCVQGKGLSLKLKELFEQTRDDYVTNIEKLPMSQRAVRLEHLDLMYHWGIHLKSPKIAISALREARQEMAPLMLIDTENEE